jgi:hypothetical protein
MNKERSERAFEWGILKLEKKGVGSSLEAIAEL